MRGVHYKKLRPIATMNKPILELNDELGILLGEKRLRDLPVEDEDEGYSVKIEKI